MLLENKSESKSSQCLQQLSSGSAKNNNPPTRKKSRERVRQHSQSLPSLRSEVNSPSSEIWFGCPDRDPTQASRDGKVCSPIMRLQGREGQTSENVSESGLGARAISCGFHCVPGGAGFGAL